MQEEQEETGGGVSIRQMTNSLLSFAFLPSASTPGLFYFTAAFRARPYILMATTQRLTPSKPLLSITVVLFLWRHILVRLTVLADIEEAAPEITLPTRAGLPRPHTLFSSLLDQKQERRSASFPALPSEGGRHGKLSHPRAFSVAVFPLRASRSPDSPLTWLQRLRAARTTDRQERGEKNTPPPSPTPPPPPTTPPLLTALFWHVMEEVN